MSNTTGAPVASVLLPVLDEERWIVEVLDRLRTQSVEDLEIIVADGGSLDRTRELVREVAAVDPRVRLLDNPGRLQGAGLNVAAAAARADVLVRLDGHAFVERDYVARCRSILERTGASVVGGVMAPVSAGGSTADAIAVANTWRWGAGPARFHTGGAAGPAETVYLGCFRRAAVEEVGWWAEDVGVNEDFELNYRIRRAGGVIWFDPSLIVGYEPRRTFSALAHQYLRYGRSKATVAQRHPMSLLGRQLAPAALAPLLFVAFVGGRSGWLARLLAGGHVIALLGLAAADRTVPRPHLLRTVWASVVMQHSWSAGFWLGFVRPFLPAGGRR